MEGIMILIVYIIGTWIILKVFSKLLISVLNKSQVLSTEIQTKGSKIVVGNKEIYTYIKNGRKYELEKENNKVKIKFKKK